MTTPLLHVDGAGRRFGRLTALDNVSLTITAGARHAVIGPNGAGKTTLLNLVAGTLPPTAGRIVFDGRDITGLPVRARARLGIGRTWQHPATFHRLSVAANLALAHHHATCDVPALTAAAWQEACQIRVRNGAPAGTRSVHRRPSSLWHPARPVR